MFVKTIAVLVPMSELSDPLPAWVCEQAAPSRPRSGGAGDADLHRPVITATVRARPMMR
jgi:hypothetical protein